MAGLYLNHVKVAEESGGIVSLPNTVQFNNLKIGGTEVINSNRQIQNITGIDFSPSSGTGTPSSSLLDDYEEGTWTVSWVNLTGTPNNTTGYYVKIGTTVFITYSAGSGTISGTRNSVRFSLPFTPVQLAVSTMFTETVESGGAILFYPNGFCYPFTFNNDYFVFSGTYITS